MSQFAHAEIKVSTDETDVELGFYNYDDEESFEPGDSWDELLANLGRLGFELVSVVASIDANTYWFKKALG